MTGPGRKIVVLGMLANMPVPGVMWQTLHYLEGLARLGFDPYYVEANARTPSMLMERATDDGSARAAALIARVMDAHGLSERWAYHALHDDGRCYGMSKRALTRLYKDAELVINLHGGTEPRPEFGDRLVFIETDPVQLQIELHDGVAASFEFLDAHSALFTFAENLGRPDCQLPVCERFSFMPTRQPVVLEHWAGRDAGPGKRFTTVGNWRQAWRTVLYRGEMFSWSKDQQWRKFLELPRRTGEAFELALSSYQPHHREQLEAKGWSIRPAAGFSTEPDGYRDYIAGSRGEFTVAKDQNIRFRTGWFSDRSATYLAAGRPVITQDTAFGCVLPIGEGLFAVQSIDEAVEAVEAVTSDYGRHRRAASEIAREFFDSDRVLGDLVTRAGVSLPASVSSRVGASVPTPAAAASEPAARWTAPVGTRHLLGPQSLVLALIPHFKCEEWLEDCLDSLVRQSRPLDGIVVIDDASDDPPVRILQRFPAVTLLHADRNVGPYRLIQQVIEDTRYDAFMFQDADDWSAPTRLELLLDHAAETGAELLGSQEMRVFCDEPEVAGIQWPLDVNEPFKDRPTAFPLLHPTSLVSRDLLMAIGGFSSGLRFGGDAELLRRAHYLSRCVNVPAFSYYRRIRQNSLTTAPATAIGTPGRKRVMDLTFGRAKANVERVEAGIAPDLSPIETAPPVTLTHLTGPPLLGSDMPRPVAATRRTAPVAIGRDDASAEPVRPLFVVGADRSGVTALACAIEQHPALPPAAGAGGLGALAEQLTVAREAALAADSVAFGVVAPSGADFHAHFGAAAAALAAANAGRWVDGSWQNAAHVPALAALFPEARFIHVVRDVDSAVGALADPPLGSAGATGGTQVPARLRTKVPQGEALARWTDAVTACGRAQALLGPERMLQVRFADLLADPEALLRRCLEFAGESYRPECLRPLRQLRARFELTTVEPDDAVAQAAWKEARKLSLTLAGAGPTARRAEAPLLETAAPGTTAHAPGAIAAPPQPARQTPRGRIVMVTDHFPKVSETFFVRKFLGLRRRGWDVHVVCNRSNKQHWAYFPDLREQIDLSRLHVTTDVEAELIALKPDLVHFGYGTLARGRMHLRDLLQCKMVVSFRGYDINHFGLDDPACFSDVFGSADHIHAVSEAVWHRARRRGCSKDRPHSVITDAVDTRWFEPREAGLSELPTPERPLRVLSVGRLHWKKGHTYALNALRRLVAEGLPVQYRIAGDGDQRDALEYDIEDQGLGEHVELVGACTAEQVRGHLEWADVFLHPSLSEAFGVSVLEAQAMGVPVVCSSAGGLAENVADGETGFVVAPRDDVALAERVARIAADPELHRRMREAARSRARARFDAKRQLDRFEELYRTLLDTGQDTEAERNPGAARRTRRLEEMQRELSGFRRQAELLGKRVWAAESVEEVHRFARSDLAGATVAVVSRGDNDLVNLGAATGWHFPRLDDGTYAGYHPKDSAAAIVDLERVRAQGATHFIIPVTSLWWLDHYEGLHRHLEERYARIGESPGRFVAYSLQRAARSEPAVAASAAPRVAA
jgi:glycosyltransferase involved in cell wall biosynthesis